MGNKLTLEEIDAIYRNKTEYHVVFYKGDNEFRYVREDIDKARSLFFRTVCDLYHLDFCSNISTNWLTHLNQNYYKIALLEVSLGEEPITLLGYGKESDEEFYARWKAIEDKKREEQQRKRDEERVARSYQNLMEFLGTSTEEYKESVTLFAALHGTTPDKWGIKV
jgi:hypothetical protein